MENSIWFAGVILAIIAGLFLIASIIIFFVLDISSLIKDKSGKLAIKRIDDCLNKGVNFTQETTLAGVRTIKTIQKARELDYYIRLYYVGVSSSDESIKRIKNRVEKGGHNIPTEDVERRYNKRFEDLAKVLPYCNEVRFFDNENGFIEKAEYKNGLLITKSEIIPQWLKDLEKYLKSH